MYEQFANNNNQFNLEDLDQELIYYTYLKYLPNVNKSFKSPFKEERTPSFRFFVNNNNQLRFKCFSTGHHGDAIELVKLLFNLTGKEAIEKIKYDLGYGSNTSNGMKYDKEFINSIKRVDLSEPSSAIIEVLLREFNLDDLCYWGTFGLSKEDLNYYNVKACQEVWLNNKMYYKFKKYDPCYRYKISNKYKIYRPNRVGKGKWLTNCTKKNIQGFRFLPEKGELLVITKSYKDVMVLNKHLGLNAIAFNSESSNISNEMTDYLYSRFDNIVLLYDNDEAGINAAKLINEYTDIPYVYIPESIGCKDPSELYADKGKQVFTEILKQILNI